MRAGHVMARIRDIRAGKETDTKFGRRFKGTGAIAQLVAQRFRLACRAHGLNRSPHVLNTSAFAVPKEPGQQLDLF